MRIPLPVEPPSPLLILMTMFVSCGASRHGDRRWVVVGFNLVYDVETVVGAVSKTSCIMNVAHSVTWVFYRLHSHRSKCVSDTKGL